jgi:hypothetical protein
VSDTTVARRGLEGLKVELEGKYPRADGQLRRARDADKRKRQDGAEGLRTDRAKWVTRQRIAAVLPSFLHAAMARTQRQALQPDHHHEQPREFCMDIFG